MTPSHEIAKNLTQCWQPQSGEFCQCSMCVLRPQIVTAIDEARKEAVEEDRKDYRKLMADDILKSIINTRKLAFEKAAEIAESFTDGYAGAEIAKAIRAESENI